MIEIICIQPFDFTNLYAYGYEQVFQTMRMLRLPYPQAEQMFRRMVFNVLATNFDDHTKNFAFRLRKGEKWELTPAYDICYSYDASNVWVNQQTLSVKGKHRNIGKSDLMTIAKANNIKKGEKIIDEINQVVKQWGDFASKVKVQPDLHKDIQMHLNTI